MLVKGKTWCHKQLPGSWTVADTSIDKRHRMGACWGAECMLGRVVVDLLPQDFQMICCFSIDSGAKLGRWCVVGLPFGAAQVGS
jgi:hypothetical protein